MPAYRFKCRNTRCNSEFHKYFPVEEFEEQQYKSGWACFDCGFARMGVIKSNKAVKDGFKPGYQRNIKKVCDTYGAYKQALKDMGLVEIGYDEINVEPESEDFSGYWTDDVLRELYTEDGVSLDGQLVKGLQSGELS